MLLLTAAAAAGHEPIHWLDLGLRNGIDLGFFTLRYYSLAYLAGIVLGYWHLTRMIRLPGAPLAQRHADDLFFYCTLGIILGGRLGYALFYSPDFYLFRHPVELVQLWHGGMSFHGGLIGVVLALVWVSWRNGLNLLRVGDYISVCVPFGMLFGRLANFVNGELWGRVTDASVPWAMVFPDGGPLPRHPSQLYEAGLEGLAMMIVMLVLFWKTRARFRPGLLVGVFATGISLARFCVEFFREPDAQLQDFALRTGLSMGQWLTIPLMVFGLAAVTRALMKPPLATGRPATA
ncbi:prolipoprotein diacylglyceryl transferase [Novosphingobium album (ex Liu et al. 2023)]|uniref:Phosphatidylglycerol--prolipoprotein diacylglyceryl transferase n=1 Tax=Novosphingobium album (ex Liu et al. 2023) TaxID=3031130 RepID=A0ABT5WL03_9SPHN|nr:prolipoprotein diacylglyceryl transferase [Novosphingobium album (ex Liu et al. 2023)]MDE8650721.1 prolipoprotein diacylglyceryl transferase [Novosphingobium album (ex Liu et al. 2023)]